MKFNEGFNKRLIIKVGRPTYRRVPPIYGTLVIRISNFILSLAKLRKATVSFVMSTHPHESVLLPLDGF
jgi:hypothetical protein